MEHNIFLAIEALKENFGDIVSKVGEAIIKSDGAQSTLSSIVHSTKLKRNQVKKCLCVLEQHNLVKFQNENPCNYYMNVNNVLHLVLVPHYIYFTHDQYGETASIFMEKLLLNGKISTKDLIKSVMNELKKSFEECTDEQLLKSFNSAKTAFTQLVRAHFLQRERNLVQGDNCDLQFDRDEDYQYYRFIEPKLHYNSLMENGNDGPKHKMRKIENDDDVLWSVNISRLNDYVRDDFISKHVGRKYNPIYETLVRCIFRLHAKSDFLSYTNRGIVVSTNSFSSEEINNIMPKSPRLSNQMADDYLQKLSLMNDGIVNYDETEGKYSINVKNAVYKICEAHLMKRILKKFGKPQMQICGELLDSMKTIDQIQRVCVMDPRAVTLHVFNLYEQNYLENYEFTKTPGLSQGNSQQRKSSFCYYVNKCRLITRMLDDSYRAIGNAFVVRHDSSVKNKRNLIIEEKIEAQKEEYRQAGEDASELDGEMEELCRQQVLKHHRLLKYTHQLQTDMVQLTSLLQLYLQYQTQDREKVPRVLA